MRRRSSTGSAFVTSSPSRMMRPLVGSMSRLTIFSVVVLPHPDGPTRQTSSPRGTAREISFTATVPSANRLLTLSRAIATSPAEATPEPACAARPAGSPGGSASAAVASTRDPLGGSELLQPKRQLMVLHAVRARLLERHSTLHRPAHQFVPAHPRHRDPPELPAGAAGAAGEMAAEQHPGDARRDLHDSVAGAVRAAPTGLRCHPRHPRGRRPGRLRAAAAGA